MRLTVCSMYSCKHKDVRIRRHLLKGLVRVPQVMFSRHHHPRRGGLKPVKTQTSTNKNFSSALSNLSTVCVNNQDVFALIRHVIVLPLAGIRRKPYLVTCLPLKTVRRGDDPRGGDDGASTRRHGGVPEGNLPRP